MIFKKKPFPAKVRWLQVWRHRWELLDIINNVAYTDNTALHRTLVEGLGATPEHAELLRTACRKAIAARASSWKHERD